MSACDGGEGPTGVPLSCVNAARPAAVAARSRGRVTPGRRLVRLRARHCQSVFDIRETHVNSMFISLPIISLVFSTCLVLHIFDVPRALRECGLAE